MYLKWSSEATCIDTRHARVFCVGGECPFIMTIKRANYSMVVFKRNCTLFIPKGILVHKTNLQLICQLKLLSAFLRVLNDYPRDHTAKTAVE
jgi:hypothetical protein